MHPSLSAHPWRPIRAQGRRAPEPTDGAFGYAPVDSAVAALAPVSSPQA